jgi:hypothetical protein
MLLVGVPVLGLLGILEAGRGLSAPPAIGGEWGVEFGPAPHCAGGPAGRLQPALSITQSGAQALITFHDGRATTLEATINGAAVTAKSLTATITGKADKRTLEGLMSFDGCAPIAFRAVRQAPGKRGN